MVHRVNLCVQAVETSYFIQLEQHLFVALCAMQSLQFHLQEQKWLIWFVEDAILL
ncbi:hypothetical protein QJS04_geneDACA012112 [Acorus gramineus]|uniref:Uncharacterized protein n=1 Tax=Acorus gramineus TaxID=55184 RepID=A0AAV9B7S3_ACOGR|nr:hypothetical protein QJS04_geneDACA012112 [Acorus gramineus]